MFYKGVSTDYLSLNVLRTTLLTCINKIFSRLSFSSIVTRKYNERDPRITFSKESISFVTFVLECLLNNR